jgi:hypothetical protein
MKRAFPVDSCPAQECESRRPVHLIRRDEATELYERLEAVAHGEEYDYYVCDGWCHRVWRMPKIEMWTDWYRAPQWIGYWDRYANEQPSVYPRAQEIMLKVTSRPSRSEPTRPARNKTDATRGRRRPF